MACVCKSVDPYVPAPQPPHGMVSGRLLPHPPRRPPPPIGGVEEPKCSSISPYGNSMERSLVNSERLRSIRSVTNERPQKAPSCCLHDRNDTVAKGEIGRASCRESM